MRKYNIALKGMVNNYREKLNVSIEDYTNEELYSLIECWSGMSTEEETLEAIREDVKNKTKR